MHFHDQKLNKKCFITIDNVYIQVVKMPHIRLSFILLPPNSMRVCLNNPLNKNGDACSTKYPNPTDGIYLRSPDYVLIAMHPLVLAVYCILFLVIKGYYFIFIIRHNYGVL